MLVIKETNNKQFNNMKGIKVNIEEKTRKLNEFRIECINKSFTWSELKEIFKERGITTDPMTITNILKLFPFETIGHSKIYEMPKTPIHISLLKKAWEERAKYQKENKKKNISVTKEDLIKISDEESALNLLRSKGYQIKKCIGFDVERFAKENPDLYKKYLKYEII